MRYKLLFPDAVIPENILQDGFGVDEVGAEDLIEGCDGATEVFGNEIGGNSRGQGEAGSRQGIGSLTEGFVVTDIGNKCGIAVGNQVGFQLGKGSAQFRNAQTVLRGEFNYNSFFTMR